MPSFFRSAYQLFAWDVGSAIFFRDLLSEFVSSACLAFVLGNVALITGPPQDAAVSIVRAALAMGFVVFVLIETFGHLSGAHMNPAVSLAFVCVRQISIIKGCCYVLLQLLGTTAGVSLAYAVTPKEYRTSLTVFGLHDGIAVWQAVLFEAMLTFMFIGSVIGGSDSKHRRVYVPSLTAGCAIACDILIAARYTGACMNPALAFGAALFTQNFHLHWVYWLGPLFGSALVTIIYRSFTLTEERFGYRPVNKVDPNTIEDVIGYLESIKRSSQENGSNKITFEGESNI